MCIALQRNSSNVCENTTDKQVFSDMDLLGWYTTGDTPGPPDLLVHKQICDLLESPIFLKLNPMARHTDVSTSTLFEAF